MREIKFRAWDKKHKKMYHGGDIRTALAFPDEDTEIMQYTGLKDKNGKEIYEGDIIKYPHGEVPYGPVKWTGNGFWVKEPSEYTHMPHDREIIGNIYENPELQPTDG